MCKSTGTVTTNDTESEVTFTPFQRLNGPRRDRKPIDEVPQEVKNLLAGGIAGMIAKSVVAPMDRIKIIYQVSSEPFHLSHIPKVIQNIVKTEGITALWRGNMATMIRVFPYAGTQFMVFNKCKEFFISSKSVHDVPTDVNTPTDIPFNNVHGETSVFRDAEQYRSTANTITKKNIDTLKWKLTSFESLISGSCAGACSVLLTYPLDLARAQLAVSKKKSNINSSSDGFVQVLINNHTKGGIGGLFRGVTPTLFGILPYSGIAFTINEQSKRQIFNLKGREPTTIEKIQCGAVSGLLAQSLTYPFEVTRRRMQTIGIVPTSGNDTAANLLRIGTSNNHQSGQLDTKFSEECKLKSRTSSLSSPMVSSNPPTMLRTIQHLMKEQGTRGFFKGLSMNWLKGPISFGISFTTFDILQDWMSKEAIKISTHE